MQLNIGLESLIPSHLSDAVADWAGVEQVQHLIAFGDQPGGFVHYTPPGYTPPPVNPLRVKMSGVQGDKDGEVDFMVRLSIILLSVRRTGKILLFCWSVRLDPADYCIKLAGQPDVDLVSMFNHHETDEKKSPRDWLREFVLPQLVASHPALSPGAQVAIYGFQTREAVCVTMHMGTGQWQQMTALVNRANLQWQRDHPWQALWLATRRIFSPATPDPIGNPLDGIEVKDGWSASDKEAVKLALFGTEAAAGSRIMGRLLHLMRREDRVLLGSLLRQGVGRGTLTSRTIMGGTGVQMHPRRDVTIIQEEVESEGLKVDEAVQAIVAAAARPPESEPVDPNAERLEQMGGHGPTMIPLDETDPPTASHAVREKALKPKNN